jgi:CRP-like cAMP-binding protein
MNRIVTDELDRIDEGFAGNLLLATFTAEDRALVEPFLTFTDLEPGNIIRSQGSRVSSAVFPFGPTMVSLAVDLADGRSIEVASIGLEGAVGGIVSCGHAPAFARSEVLVPGHALQIPLEALEDAKMRSAHIRNLFCRYSDFLLSQVMQTLACISFHPIEQRAARWLLIAQDRAGDSIELTQQAFAGLLGVQRTTVNAVVQALQDEGLIATRRGYIRIVDRAGLKRRSCECYGRVESHFYDVLGVGGSGRTQPG